MAKKGAIRRFAAATVALAACLTMTSDVDAQAFSCSPRKTCKQMRSCSEAVYFLRQCGDTRRDGDGDGIPCESLCGKTLSQMNRRLAAGL